LGNTTLLYVLWIFVYKESANLRAQNGMCLSQIRQPYSVARTEDSVHLPNDGTGRWIAGKMAASRLSVVFSAAPVFVDLVDKSEKLDKLLLANTIYCKIKSCLD
jgi:hypothetical protein